MPKCLGMVRWRSCALWLARRCPSVLGALLAEPLPLPSAAVVATQRLARDDSLSCRGCCTGSQRSSRDGAAREGRSAADGATALLTAVPGREEGAALSPHRPELYASPSSCDSDRRRTPPKARTLGTTPARPRRLSPYAARCAAAARAGRSCRRRRRQRRQRPNPRPPPTPPKEEAPVAVEAAPEDDNDDAVADGDDDEAPMVLVPAVRSPRRRLDRGWGGDGARAGRPGARPKPPLVAPSLNECTHMSPRDPRAARGGHRRRCATLAAAAAQSDAAFLRCVLRDPLGTVADALRQCGSRHCGGCAG